jgi:SAM-dependent methyltransferase
MDNPVGVSLSQFWGRLLLAICLGMAAGRADAQVVVGQDGKDVVYLPTPAELVDKMLDMAAVTPQDSVIDLGSGDGRIVIAAAKRGAQAMGVEYDSPLVELSRQTAAREGVSDKATFVQADLFTTDFSQATVLTMFLLSDMMLKLQPQIFNLKPGTRVVSNTFVMDDWPPDSTVKLEPCNTWCTAHLWVVPAKVEGLWRLPQGELKLKQAFQDLSGTLTSGGSSVDIMFGRLHGDEITFVAGDVEYTGKVAGSVMEGSATRNGAAIPWNAIRTAF